MRVVDNSSFNAKIVSLYNNEYVSKDDYKSTHGRINVLHTACGNIFSTTPNRLINTKRGCPKCFGTPKSSTSEFIARLEKLYPNAYTVISEYDTTMTYIKIRHNMCGHVWQASPNRLLQKRKYERCPKCSKKIRYNTESFKQKVYELEGNNYSVLSEYVNTKTHIIMKHNICGSVYNVTPNVFVSNNRCPICNHKKIESEAVKDISKWLDDNSILYEKEKRFEKCKHKRTLPFDFYLPDYELLIEYDGRQHFIVGPAWLDSLAMCQKHDIIKNVFCEENKYSLLRINFLSNPTSVLEDLFYNEISLEKLNERELKKVNGYIELTTQY